jgi:transcriptional regulator with XRE-family HTH domain
MAKKEKIRDAVSILHGRYVKDDSERKAALQEERVNAEVARLIYDIRTNAGLSQQQLAELIGTTQSVISRLEDSDYEGRSLSMLDRIAQALNQKLTVAMTAREPQAEEVREAFQRIVAPDVPAEEDLAPEEQVNRLLSSAETLFAEGQLEAAAMLAWSAAETILRRRAQSDAPEMERQSSARVLKHLYALGRINPDIYEKLLRLMEFRNAVAHGFQPRVVPPDISDIVPDIRQLQHAA